MKKQQPIQFSTLPGWITPEVFKETRAVWQPHYKSPLTDEDVIEILLNVGNMFRLLSAEIRKEKAKR